MKLSLYRRSDGRHAWRLIADNGNIVATDGGQGYERAIDAHRMAVKILNDDIVDDVEMLAGDPHAEPSPDPDDERNAVVANLKARLDERVFPTHRHATIAMDEALTDLRLKHGDRVHVPGTESPSIAYRYPVGLARQLRVTDTHCVAHVLVHDRQGGTVATVIEA
jgi:uncharacterized protein YegP (UPF0339 family)